MVNFGRHITPILKDEPFALYGASKLGTEANVGRFGRQIEVSPGKAPNLTAEQVIDEINASGFRC